MKRGDIWIVNLEPGFGRELHKKRPALIISHNNINNNTKDVIVVPSSTQIFNIIGPEVILIDEKTGVDKPSVLLPVLIRSVDQQRLIKKIGSISKTKMEEVEEALKLVLDIDS